MQSLRRLNAAKAKMLIGKVEPSVPSLKGSKPWGS